MDLDAVLNRCRQGDQLAWEALVRSFQGRIYGIACHYLGNAEDARDAAQDIFVRIYRHLGQDVAAEHFVPWMVRIARNACLDHLRRRKSRPPSEDLIAEDLPGLADRRFNPEAQYSITSRNNNIYNALQHLSLLSREIILLKDIQGLSLEEIASQLRIPVGTAKSRSNRARLELAHRLAPVYRPDWKGTGGEE